MVAPLPTFEALFEALHRQVLALCLHVVGDRQEAEDAVQEAFIAVHRGLPTFRGESRPATWVYRIALRAALRVRARRPPAARADPVESTRERTEAVLEARDDARRLVKAIALLPVEQRSVIALFAIEGLGHREVAEVLGVPEGTVWSRLHKARKALTSALAEPSAPGHRLPNGCP
jgi:RNA polymerase sigma-70 factor (ECF subfamily)